MKLYLAGPMRGIPYFNRNSFNRHAGLLRSQGHYVYSPAEHDEKHYGLDFSKSNEHGDEAEAVSNFSFDVRKAVERNLLWITREAEGIAMMPGWENSSGSMAEWQTAKVAGIKFLYLEEVAPVADKKDVAEDNHTPGAEWDRRRMRLADEVASWSKDPSTKVGAIVVGLDARQVAVGYNGFPRGIADDYWRLHDRETKYKLTQHAERNVLDNATFDLREATLYSTMYPCFECAKSIVSRGIRRIVCRPVPVDRDLWVASSRVAASVFEEAAVSVTIWND